jgi:hypothetical protein
MRFDPSQPADQVFGVPGVAWAQLGRCFNLQGHEVTWHRETLVADDGDQREVVIVDMVMPAEAEPESEPEQRPPEYRHHNAGEMHWTALKAQLAMYDEPYTTKEAALAFLAGKGVST